MFSPFMLALPGKRFFAIFNVIMVNLHRLVLAAMAVPLLWACSKRQTLFTVMPAGQTGVEFKNELHKGKLFNILYYLYYYNGGGVATGDINNDGLPDIYFTANSRNGNRLYLNKGNFFFEDITERAGVAGTADWHTGATMADVNGDGLLDIYVCAASSDFGLTGSNALYINQGNLTFKESAEAYGLQFSGLSTQAAFFDYDHDGDLDCYLLNHSKKPHANITDTSGRRRYSAQYGDRLYRNDQASGIIKYTDVSAQAGIYQSSLGYGLGLAVADFNNDGWEDIYVGNDFHENDYYYLNNGNGTFSESGAQHFGHFSRFSMGNDAGDFNNDGHMDLITVDMLPPDEKTLKTYGSDENPTVYRVKLGMNGYQNQYSRNCLQMNNGNGTSFSDVALLANMPATDWSWSPLFADFDNDGKKDLFVSSGIVKRPVDMDYVMFVSAMQRDKGLETTDAYDEETIEKMPDGATHPFFFKGDGTSRFSDVSDAWGTGKMKGYFNGAAYADLDNDGDLDVVINRIGDKATMLRNSSTGRQSLSLVLQGDSLNTKGIGGKAYLYSKQGMQFQQLMATHGFQSSSDLKLHFGLDLLQSIDSLVVVWPNQKCQVLKQVPVGEALTLKQHDANLEVSQLKLLPGSKELFVDITASSALQWTHRENEFVDFNRQYLLPHAQSTRGPRMAVADVNGDRLDDVYVCGARGQAGALWLQQAGGMFALWQADLFARAADSEEVDALFFDANKDGYPDLYTVSGGYELNNGSAQLADHLYLNNGKGIFTDASANLPAMLVNKSCVTAADADRDGDMDLFVGVLADPGAYGYPQTSYLLLNDGSGRFIPAAESLINLKEIGMVTSAVFADINNDAWPDLLVTGEWMALEIFTNKQGRFEASEVPNSAGLWQTLFATDVNGDGHTDVLAGNWGLNSKLSSGKSGPVKLYVKDFDKNGTVEQVMACTLNGKEYTFLAKDELERPLPVLKKAYLTYGEVAGKTVDYMFYDLFKDYLELKAENLASSAFIGDGKGGFSVRPLPDALQLAPIFSFAILPDTASYMAGGNFYGVVPYEGRYDALRPTRFVPGNNKNGLIVQDVIPNLPGEVRDIKMVKTNDGWAMVVARNNMPMVVLSATAN
jgi:hypothetical protein